GTRCLRTLAVLAELNGTAGEVDRLSIWLPFQNHADFKVFLQNLLSMDNDPKKLGSRVTPRTVEKFDEYLPDDLLDRACASERLALEEARKVILSTTAD